MRNLQIVSNVFLKRNFTLNFQAICLQSHFNGGAGRFGSLNTKRFLSSGTPQQNENILVYEGPLRKRIKIVKFISLSSSMLGIALVPTVLIDASFKIIYVVTTGFMSCFFIATPILLNWITKRYVLELLYDPVNRVFTTKTFNIFNQVKETKFSAADVDVPDMPKILSSFEVQKQPLFVDANLVKDPDAYSHMMGYDKPLDLQIDLKDENKNPS